MVLPGHLAGGYLATKFLLIATGAVLSPEQTNILFAIGTLAGEAPDIDLIFFYLNQRSPSSIAKKESHRSYITHVPLFWLVICAFTILSGYLAGSAFMIFLGAVILAGTWSHLILDSIEYGIRWLAPISNKRFCLREEPDVEIAGPKGTLSFYWKQMKAIYFKGITFYAEIAITGLALWVAFH